MRLRKTAKPFVISVLNLLFVENLLQRHFESVHSNISNKTEEERRELIGSQVRQIEKQADNIIDFMLGMFISDLVAASIEISKAIAQHGKSVSDEDYIKEA